MPTRNEKQGLDQILVRPCSQQYDTQQTKARATQVSANRQTDQCNMAEIHDGMSFTLKMKETLTRAMTRMNLKDFHKLIHQS